MKRDAIPIAQGKGSKAGIVVNSDRESSHPMLITEMLTGILRACGKPAEVVRIQKRIADDVLWADGSELPWRRSPLWVVIRVSMQLCLRDESRSSPDYLYKSKPSYPGRDFDAATDILYFTGFMVFFMSQILEFAYKKDFPSHILSVMNIKISRRITKMTTTLPNFVMEVVQHVCQHTHLEIEKRWQTERNYHIRRLHWEPRTLKPKNDTALSMNNTEKYLAKVRQHSKASQGESQFTPRELPRIDTAWLATPSVDALRNQAALDMALIDFEKWVQDMLPLWAESRREDDITELGIRIEEYVTAASRKYANNPEQLSIMVLTALELWVILDTKVCSRFSLLNDYYPLFDTSAFESLLLKTSSQRARLRKVEIYLMQRRGKAKFFLPAVFGNSITENSFAVRYFNQDPDMETLRNHITTRAEVQRENKLIEFQTMVQQHDELVFAAGKREHQWFDHWERGIVHDYKCVKCKLINDAEAMRIEIHEWPLPEDDMQSKAVVFELRCPAAYAIWRDATFKIIRDLGHSIDPKSNNLAVREKLDDYQGLRAHFIKCHDSYAQRIKLVSSTKSWMKTHFKKIRYTTHIEELYVPHPLRYGLYHVDKKEWLEGRKPADITAICTFALPAPYKCLQYTMRSTNHSSNEVLSKQPDEDNEIPAHEYTAFGTLRSGNRLQWRNILRELRCRSLNFGHEATGLLLAQCAWQVGPYDASTMERIHHEDIDNAKFRGLLLDELERLLDDIQNNWQEATTLNTLTILCHRALSSYRAGGNFLFDLYFGTRCTEFLVRAAAISLKWARSLSKKVSTCHPGEVDELQTRIVMLAAICRSTLDVDHQSPATIFNSETLTTYVEAGVLIHRNSNAPSLTSSSTSLARQTRMLLLRDQRLVLRLEEYARRAAALWGIDISKVWSAYVRGSRWESLPKPNDCWLVTKTAETPEMVSQEVHFNLLSGQLLVRGLPVGRMSSKYTSHALYKELFNHQVLEVFPAVIPGMEYQTDRLISGYEVSTKITSWRELGY